MSVAPTHQGADRMQKKRKNGGGEGSGEGGGERQGSGDKERFRSGFRGRRGVSGGGGEERGRRKHMDLFKNTALYQSQAHSERIGASKGKRKRETRRGQMRGGRDKKGRIPEGHKTGNGARERERESNGQTSLHGRKQ